MLIIFSFPKRVILSNINSLFGISLSFFFCVEFLFLFSFGIFFSRNSFSHFVHFFNFLFERYFTLSFSQHFSFFLFKSNFVLFDGLQNKEMIEVVDVATHFGGGRTLVMIEWRTKPSLKGLTFQFGFVAVFIFLLEK